MTSYRNVDDIIMNGGGGSVDLGPLNQMYQNHGNLLTTIAERLLTIDDQIFGLDRQVGLNEDEIDAVRDIAINVTGEGADLTSITDRLLDLEWELHADQPYDLINATIMEESPPINPEGGLYDAKKLFDNYLNPYAHTFWMTRNVEKPYFDIDVGKKIRVGKAVFSVAMDYTYEEALRYPTDYEVYYKKSGEPMWTLAATYTRPLTSPTLTAQFPNQSLSVGFNEVMLESQFRRFVVSGHDSPVGLSQVSQIVLVAPSWPPTVTTNTSELIEEGISSEVLNPDTKAVWPDGTAPP